MQDFLSNYSIYIGFAHQDMSIQADILVTVELVNLCTLFKRNFQPVSELEFRSSQNRMELVEMKIVRECVIDRRNVCKLKN